LGKNRKKKKLPPGGAFRENVRKGETLRAKKAKVAEIPYPKAKERKLKLTTNAVKENPEKEVVLLREIQRVRSKKRKGFSLPNAGSS